jgi:Predicted glutamine amidotransferase
MKTLKLYHLFEDKLNLYGDNGNVMVLKKRCEWRNIDLEIVQVNEITHADDIDLNDADIIFLGGGSDREQSLCTIQLKLIKDDFKDAIESGTPCLTICGGYQFLGKYYQDAAGNRMNGLDILDLYTIANPERKNRMIGNILVESDQFGKIVGFENHSGETYHHYPVLGKVVEGSGNNRTDKKEGLLYKNLIGTYMHGPILSKNPQVADYLIGKALEKKYSVGTLASLADKSENEARKAVWDRYSLV